MWLIASEVALRKFLGRLGKRKTCQVYKVMRVRRNLVPPNIGKLQLTSLYFSDKHVWRYGVNDSGTTVPFKLPERFRVARGFHVYTDFGKVQGLMDYFRSSYDIDRWLVTCLVPFTAKVSNLVAVGEDNTAVFIKLTLSKATWDKVFLEAKGKLNLDDLA